MVTRKQLAALARGRAIRRANLKKRKTTKKTTKTRYQKRTKASFKDILGVIKNISGNVKAFSDVVGNFISPLGVVTSGIDNINRFSRAFKTLMEDPRQLDTDDLKQVINNMKKKLLARDPEYKNDPIFAKLDEIHKNLVFIELLKGDGQDIEAKNEIRTTLYLFSRALDDYNNIMHRH